MTKTEFHIGSTPIGTGHAPLFLADIGTFFNQDIALAEKMIRSLKNAGCGFMKGEILHRPDICLDSDTQEKYFVPGEGMISERYRDLIERKVVSLDSYEKLFHLCKSLGMETVMSVYDLEGAEFAISQGCVAIKISSSNISHEPLIRYVASKNIPILIDTGKSTFEEIARAVQWVHDSGNEQLVIEHSPNAPPAPLQEQYLQMIAVLKNTFGYPVGLSDHHDGNEMMIAAVALGADILEKGVCPDDSPFDQDVAHSMRISEVGGLLKSCKGVFEAMQEERRLLPSHRELPAGRMGLVAKSDLISGDVIGFETTDFAFPTKGIPCSDWSLVNGWKIVKPVKAGTSIDWTDVAPVAP